MTEETVGRSGRREPLRRGRQIYWIAGGRENKRGGGKRRIFIYIFGAAVNEPQTPHLRSGDTCQIDQLCDSRFGQYPHAPEITLRVQTLSKLCPLFLQPSSQPLPSFFLSPGPPSTLPKVPQPLLITTMSFSSVGPIARRPVKTSETKFTVLWKIKFEHCTLANPRLSASSWCGNKPW
jgi:hypothetical protein